MKRKCLLAISIIGATFSALAQVQEQKLQPVFESLIFPLQVQHAHGSSIVALPNGDILAVWYQGSGERKADDVRIMGARLKKGSVSWSPPFLVADSPDLPDCNPVVFLNSANTLCLAWIAVLAHRWENSLLRFRTSTNYLGDGQVVWTWQDDILLAPDDSFAEEVAAKFKVLPETHQGTAAYAPGYDEMIIAASRDQAKRSIGWMPRIKPLTLKTGRILLPLYSDGFNLSLVAISDDDAKTWHPSLPIVGRGNVQPALVERKDGHIIAYMRDNGDAPGRVQVSESADGGRTWTAAIKTDIPNTASVELIVLRDGRWVFVGNDEEDGRYRLSIYFSADEGRNWKTKKTLELVDKGMGSFSYPCLIQTADGFLHLSYSYSLQGKGETIKYLVLDPASQP